MTVVRLATGDDAKAVHEFGASIPELRVTDAEFMSVAEIESAVFAGRVFIAEDEGKIVGFTYANPNDTDRPRIEKQACIVSIAVDPSHRRQGVATKLYEFTLKELQKLGVEFIYAWANPKSGVINFLSQQDFTKGNSYVWMEKALRPQ